MAIKIGSNFTFQGEQPNFERDRFATKAAMKAFPETSIDDGHLSYCAEDGNTYQFKSSNSVDDVTGKWRVFKADVDLSAYATKDSVAIDLAKKVDIAIPRLIYFGNKPSNIKILSIKIPNTQYRTIYLECTIVSRYYNTDIVIGVNTDYTPYKFDVIKSATSTTSWDTKENLYYFFDEVNYNLELYYNLVPHDSIAVKVTSAGGNIDFTYNTNIEKVDTIPENAILVEDRNYGTGNLFFATPDRARGVTKLRAITINDLPNLSSKYQALNSNGYQPNPLMINARVGADSNSGYKYLTALTYGLPDNIPYKASPDWYFATDGTLQDIKTKIPKVVLDDAVSTTSDNGVKNSVITQYVDSKVTTINSSVADIRSSLESTQTDFVDLRNKVNAMPKTVFITQAAYNALTTKDANTIYYING